jgi:hypothetical protein
MPKLAWEWARRIFFNPNSTAGLDWGTELWKWDVNRYESAPGIAAALQRAGRSSDDDDVLYYATRNLLVDVVDAAGGVEREHIRLHESMNLAQETYDGWQQQRSRGNRAIAGSESMGMSDPSIEDAWYSLEEMLIWTRVLDDRLKRRGPQGNSDQGLIPALADGLRRDAIIQARSRLLTSTLNETQHFVNLNLHSQPIALGTKSARLRNGRVVLDFPDRVSSSIRHRVELTYNDGRDGVAFADATMSAIGSFMNEMFDAFEANIPPRLSKQ